MEAQVFRFTFRDYESFNNECLIRYRTTLEAARESVPFRFRFKFTITKILK